MPVFGGLGDSWVPSATTCTPIAHRWRPGLSLAGFPRLPYDLCLRSRRQSGIRRRSDCSSTSRQGLASIWSPSWFCFGPAPPKVSARPLAWVLRTGCYLGLLLAAVCLSRPRQRLDARKRAGWALIAVGAAIFELGVLDMHLFGVIQIAHGNPLWDIVFHNVGPALALAGTFLLLRAGAGRGVTSSRSSRSTPMSARPSASAFAVPLTPRTR